MTTQEKEISLYRPKPKTLTSIKFKYYKNIYETKKYDQEQFDIRELIPKENNVCNGYLAYNILDYDIVAHFYDCSLSGNYILNNKIIPIIYADIYVARKILNQPIFRIFLNFEYDKETLEKIKLPQTYFNSVLYGKLTISLDVLEKYKKVLLENNENQKIFDVFTCDKKFPNKKFFVNYVVQLMQSDMFKNIIKEIINSIENEVNDALDYAIAIPKKIINLKEIQKNPSLLDDINSDSCSEDNL